MDKPRMTAEISTDFDCQATGLPAKHWGAAVFNVDDEEIVLEISAEEKIIIALQVGDEFAWKGTLEGFKILLKGDNSR